MARKTQQEEFWSGRFGDNYIEMIAANTALFSKILDRTHGVSSVIEFGANIGLNLIAIRRLLPEVSLAAVEINKSAVHQLERLKGVSVIHSSIFDFKSNKTWDLALSKGVLIHIKPKELPQAYDLLYGSSRRYICLAEYYNPTPADVTYRGHKGKLFKRDFAGEMLDRFKGLALLDYGFAYRRDNYHFQDDITWFLLEKT